MNKRAQFFLIGGLLIATIVLSVGAVQNTAVTTSTHTRTIDLSQEVSYEAHQVIDNGIVQGKSAADIETQMRQLVREYSRNNPDSDIQVIYGTPAQLKYVEKNLQNTERVTLDTIESDTEQFELTEDAQTLQVNVELPPEEDASVKRIQREFSIKEGQNIFIIIKKQVHNEREVAVAS